MSGTIKSYQDLEVWQLSVELSLDVYKATSRFPTEEKFGLMSQMRRASVSIPSNIAEGFGRETTQSFVSFLRVAQGSLKELETQLIISRRLEFLGASNADDLMKRADQIGRMLNGLTRSLLASKRK